MQPFPKCTKACVFSRKLIGEKDSLSTIRNVLHKAGQNGRKARCKPFINKRNQGIRLNFAKKPANNDFSFWRNVFFKVNLMYLGRMVYPLYGGAKILNPQ